MASDVKTENILKLLQAFIRARKHELTDKQIKTLDGIGSKATFYRYLNLFLNSTPDRPAILSKFKNDENEICYRLENKEWLQFLNIENELEFILKSYQQLGHLMPKISLEEIPSKVKGIDQKFYFHTKKKTKDELINHEQLKFIINCLVNNTKILFTYNSKKVEIFPLAIVQYQDELYLVAYKFEMTNENIRTYKISRIQQIDLSYSTSFKYPSKSKWDPKVYFKDATGIIVDEVKHCQYKVFGHSRNLIKEKSFLNAQLISSHEDFDLYKSAYTSIDEFVGQLFVYGQDIVISEGYENEDVREYLIKKAEAILKNNQIYVKKAV